MTTRRKVEVELRFDWPATEEEAADTVQNHLAATGVYVHEVRAFAPGVERVAGTGMVYTWRFEIDAEFEALGDASLVQTLGPLGLVDVNGNPIGSNNK